VETERYPMEVVGNIFKASKRGYFFTKLTKKVCSARVFVYLFIFKAKLQIMSGLCSSF